VRAVVSGRVTRGWLPYYLRRLRQAYGELEEERKLRERFPRARIEGGVRVVSPHLLEIGDDVLVQRNTVLHCGGLSWSQGRGRIALGDRSILGCDCVLWGGGTIEFGEGSECAPRCMIFSSAQDFAAKRPEPGAAPLRFGAVRIGSYVSLFAGIIVSPGVTVGDGAVVAAGSVVITDIPQREFWGGVPARRIRELGPW
jgi:acetyltransferase-like isoleucine patch superfamily enzyme